MVSAKKSRKKESGNAIEDVQKIEQLLNPETVGATEPAKMSVKFIGEAKKAVMLAFRQLRFLLKVLEGKAVSMVESGSTRAVTEGDVHVISSVIEAKAAIDATLESSATRPTELKDVLEELEILRSKIEFFSSRPAGKYMDLEYFSSTLADIERQTKEAAVFGTSLDMRQLVLDTAEAIDELECSNIENIENEFFDLALSQGFEAARLKTQIEKIWEGAEHAYQVRSALLEKRSNLMKLRDALKSHPQQIAPLSAAIGTLKEGNGKAADMH